MKVRRLVGFLIAALFVLTTVVAFAAEESYVLIKDKNGVCKVIKSDHKTPATIAGPFKTKAEAEKAKEKECAKKPGESSKPVTPQKKDRGGLNWHPGLHCRPETSDTGRCVLAQSSCLVVPRRTAPQILQKRISLTSIETRKTILESSER